jgi:16S rRNA processing protein RimM
MEEKIVMGKILGPHGIKGWIKIHPFTEKKDSLIDHKILMASKDEKLWQSFEVESMDVGDKFILAKFKGVDDRNAAEKLNKFFISLDKSSLPKLDENNYYWHELIGLDVKNNEGMYFGKVDSLIETGANDVLVVLGDKEYLIPYIKQVILEVNLETNMIRVDWQDDY